MKDRYIIAENAFTVEYEEDLPAWSAIKGRFQPFAEVHRKSESGSEADDVLEPGFKANHELEPVVRINLRRDDIPEPIGDLIYEPDHAGLTDMASCAYRFPDNRLVLDFRKLKGTQPLVRLLMSPDFSNAEIILDREGKREESYFLTHALMLAFMMSTARNGTLIIHSSTVLYDGKAYLFQGKSGTGKSTHASLWLKNIPGAELLNDDNPILRIGSDGTAMAYGSPWSGKSHCYRNVGAPVGAFVRIVRDSENHLVDLRSPLKAYASLTPSIFFLPFLGEESIRKRHETIERLAIATRCCEMHCRPDADASFACFRGLTNGDAFNK